MTNYRWTCKIHGRIVLHGGMCADCRDANPDDEALTKASAVMNELNPEAWPMAATAGHLRNLIAKAIFVEGVATYQRGREDGIREGEIIICAAVRYKSKYPHMEVCVGNYHACCFAAHGAFGSKDDEELEQGFVTSRRRFVNRKEGLAIAEAAGQIVTKHEPKDELMSEDMLAISECSPLPPT